MPAPIAPEPPQLDPSPTPPPEQERDFLLYLVPIPARIHYLAERMGIRTLRQLAQVSPLLLLAERNIGRRSIAETGKAMKKLLGISWGAEAWARLPPKRRGEGERSALPSSPPAPRRGWDELRLALTAEGSAVELDRLVLPARVVYYAEREQLSTLGDLAKRSSAELLSARNFGRRSLRAITVAVAAYADPTAGGPAILAAPEPPPRRPPSVGLLESWKEQLDALDPTLVEVFVRRSGLTGSIDKPRFIVQARGLSTREMIGQEDKIVRRLRRDKEWILEVVDRAGTALSAGSVPLATLANDPWWAAATALPAAIGYFGRHLARGAFHVVEIGGKAYLSRSTPDAAREATTQARDLARRIPLPVSLADFRAKVMAPAKALDEVLAGALWDDVLSGVFVAEAQGRTRVIGVVGERAEAILAILKASYTPLSLDEVLARTGDPGTLPEEVLFFGPRLVGVERHFSRYAEWMDRLVPVAIEAMKRRARGRQWEVRELFDVVAKKVELPRWLDLWHLGSLLRRSGKVQWLTRMRVALLGGPEHMVNLRVTLHQVLHDHGGPMPLDELRRELGKKTSFNEMSLLQYLNDPVYVRLGEHRIGLVDRDVPGGDAAKAKARAHLAALLEERGRGLNARELREAVAPLSRVHARWTPEMICAAIRPDGRFRINAVQSVGLQVWSGTRVPTRPQILRACVDEGGGRASVAAVQQRFVQVYGAALTDKRLRAMSDMVHLRVRDGWVEATTPAVKLTAGAGKSKARGGPQLAPARR